MIEKVHNYIDSNFQKHVEKTQEFLRLPSISLTNQGLIETAHWLKKQLIDLGANVKLVGQNAPLVFSHLESGKAKTLLVYGMYDVQPTEGQDWMSPPFAANIANIPGIGSSIIARGACNSKGPLVGFLNVIETLIELGELPLNIIFTIEGEEEIGSPALPEFYIQNRDWLVSKVDAGFEPFWAEYGTDVLRPIISLGSKGIVTIDLICRGGAWGGPIDSSVHSSVGAWISSPVWKLLKAVNTLIDENENILIPDFNEEVIPPSEDDEKLLIELSKTFNEKLTLELMRAYKFKVNDHGINLLRRYLFTPSIQVGPLTHADGDVISSEAKLRLSIRLVPGMKPQRTVDKIKQHLNNSGFNDIEIITVAQYPSSRTNLHEKIVSDLFNTYKEFGVEPQVWPFLASATPYYLFSDILKKPYAWGGLGKAGNSHSKDEYVTLEGLKLFEKSIATFLFKFAKE